VGFEGFSSSPEELAAFMKVQLGVWEKMVKDATSSRIDAGDPRAAPATEAVEAIRPGTIPPRARPGNSRKPEMF
jgi:hypothetical protein